MLRDLDLKETLLRDPSAIPAFVSEVLRVEAPTQGPWRSVKDTIEMHGVTIPAGSTAHLRYGAANLDERQFACAAAPDVNRANTRRHLAFASGEHRCLGEHLTVLEQEIALVYLLRNFPRIRLSQDRTDFTHLRSYVLRGLIHLYVDCS